MVEAGTPSAHVVLLPVPAQGHINPMVCIARFFADLDICVTLALTARAHASLTAAAPGQDLLDSCKNIRLEVLPDGLPADPTERVPLEALGASMALFHQGAHDLLHRLLHQQLPTKSTAPNPTAWIAPCCIIVDSILTWGHDLARQFGLPQLTLWTSSASSLSIGIHVPDLVARGYLPATNPDSLNRHIDFLPGLSSLCISDLPALFLTQDGLQSPPFQFLRMAFEHAKDAERVLVNSIHELEKGVMEALRTQDGVNIVPIGPLFLMKSSKESSRTKGRALSLLKEDRLCLSWLDQQEKASVLYVSFGSMSSIEGHVFEELAHGLEVSGERFLWVIRPEEHVGTDVNGAATMEEVLPQGFTQRTAERGLVVSWAPQLEVLAHPSVAAFLSHCGWNSVLESLSNGVPMLGFPQQADQRTNLKHIVHDWKVGVPLLPTSFEQEQLQRSHVQGSVMAIMRGGEAESIRKRALHWRGIAHKAAYPSSDIDDTSAGMGSSMSNLRKLANDIKVGHFKQAQTD